MSEDQIQELRAQLEAMRTQTGKVFDRLTRIETMLGERCAGRGNLIDKLGHDVEKLKLNQAKVIGAAALLSVVIGYVLKGLGLE